MKKYVLVSLIFVFFLGSSFNDKAEKEKEEVKAAIEESQNAYLARDFNRISSAWVHDEYAIRIGANKNNFAFHEGWEKQDTRYKNIIKNNPEPNGNKEVNSNYRIKVYKGSA